MVWNNMLTVNNGKSDDYVRQTEETIFVEASHKVQRITDETKVIVMNYHPTLIEKLPSFWE